MPKFRPKKYLGQHFLTDLFIAERIVSALSGHGDYWQLLEIGPGTGVLTRFLVKCPWEVHLIDIDPESIHYLHSHFGELRERTLRGDFLKDTVEDRLSEVFAIIGNFPYNISSQIFFKILDLRNRVPEVVCMIQKEVADRLAAPPGNKVYGILSVLLRTYYDLDYLFTVKPDVFNPPPRVNSAVIRLRRNERSSPGCDEVLFRRVVKAGFQMRRKTLRNALKPINLPEQLREDPLMNQRAETLSVEDFITLTNRISACRN